MNTLQLKTIEDFNIVDIESWDEQTISLNDVYKIENIIKCAYTFDGKIEEPLVKTAIKNVVGNLTISIKRYESVQSSVKYAQFLIKDKDDNVLMIMNTCSKRF